MRRPTRIVDGMGHDQRGRPDPRRGVRTPPPRPSQATYWRRRATVLAVGIGLLTSLGWAANGMLAARSTADQTQPPGSTATAGPTMVPVSRDSVHATSSPSPRPGSSTPPRPSATPSHEAARARACAPGQVTLRLSSPQGWYQMGTTPRFTVHAISQAARPCRFNMGTASVSVVISAAGQRVWGSADCVRSGGSDMVVLASGTPAVVHLSWNRRTSAPSCGGATHPARPGEYQVTAVAGSLHSPTVNFVLGAEGASGP
jgi:hypothetical protein